MYPDVDIE